MSDDNWDDLPEDEQRRRMSRTPRSAVRPASPAPPREVSLAEADRQEAAEPVDAKYGLPADEVAQIIREAHAKVEAEEKRLHLADDKLARRKLLDEQVLLLRRSKGLANYLDDIVSVTINTPPFTDKIVLDGVMYHQGFTYSLSRRVANDIWKIQSDGWKAEDAAGNPNKKYYRLPGQNTNPYALWQQNMDGSLQSRSSAINGSTGAQAGIPQLDNPAIDALIRQVR